jgi:hypothetical protein
MPEFRRSRSELDAAGIEAARATARPSGLDLKFSQRRAVAGKADQLFIALKGAPPFGRALEAARPLAFWAQTARSARRSRTRWVEALPAEAGAGATDRQKCVALAAQRRSACSGILRLSPP